MSSPSFRPSEPIPHPTPIRASPSRAIISRSSSTSSPAPLYIVELTDELAQWHSGEAFIETVSTVPGPGGSQTVRVRSRSLVGVKPKEFMRLRVSGCVREMGKENYFAKR